ncbi:glycoside hydrolase family 5 protein [Antarcticibacterium arcticum]|uniref:glycoside hydrolase family 5 protein n=1 Tax=Antarcticibacterium arcticum TaxID=2585771 RepID=UPI0021D04E8E|nr:glycoside hydrolase family 5 protein [Antarcticibacterium arcticum]
MKRTIMFILLIFSLTGYSQEPGSEQGFLRAEEKKIIDATGENVILRGIGLGGHMLQEGYMLKVPFSGQQYVFKQHMQELIGKERTEEFYSTWLSNFTQKKDIDSLKSWGFNSIRLPMHYNLYTLPVEEEPVAGENTWLERGFEMTDQMVEWCRDNGMYLILDMHATPGGRDMM